MRALEATAFFVGGSPLPTLIYGIQLTITWNCFHRIFQTNGVPLWIPCYLLASFILATAALVIISFYCANAVFVSRSPNYAGPLDALLAASKETPYIAATSCCLAVSRLADLLLLHRLFSIYRHKIWICFVPAIIWMCTIGSGICFIAVPILTKRRQLSRYVGIGHWSLAALFCVVTTTLIVIRLLRARGKVSPSPIVKEYTSIITLIVESSLAYTVVLVVFAISYGRGSLIRIFLFPAIIFLHVVASMLIVQRMIFNMAVFVHDQPSQDGSHTTAELVSLDSRLTETLPLAPEVRERPHEDRLQLVESQSSPSSSQSL